MGRTQHMLTGAAAAGAANIIKKNLKKSSGAAAAAAAVATKAKKQKHSEKHRPSPPPAPKKAKKSMKVRSDEEPAPAAKRKLVFPKQAAKPPAAIKLPAATKLPAARKPQKTKKTGVKRVSKAAVSDVVLPRKHHWHPGTVALREIRQLQKTTYVTMQHSPFARLYRLALRHYYPHGDFRVQRQALHMAQCAFEAFVDTVLRNANAQVIRGTNRITVTARDLASTIDTMKPKSIPDLDAYYKELDPILNNPKKYKRAFISASTVSTFADVKQPKRSNGIVTV